MRVLKLHPKDNEEIELNDITVLVGPNNSGKSQTLRDIRDKLEKGKNAHPVLIEKIDFDFPETYDEFKTQLNIRDDYDRVGGKVYYGLRSDLLEVVEIRSDERNANYSYRNEFEGSFLGNYTRFFVSYLSSSNRLQLADTVKSFDSTTEEPKKLIHLLYLERDKEADLMKAFKDAFNMDIRLDYSGLTQFCFRVAQKMPQIPDDPRNAGPIMKEISRLEDQGDGFRSLVGIILGLIFSENRIVLLDEPEAFLHPAQARFLGKWIGDNKDIIKGQLIISTHNAHFLAGLISSNRRIDIYRLNRIGDNTQFNKMSAENTKRLFESPLLSSQRVIEGVFYKGVAVCEADADRAVYQGVCSINLNSTEDIQFIHAQNKQTLGNVAVLLNNANIPVALIADIDAINDEKVLSDLITAQTDKAPDKSLLDARKQIADSINKRPEEEIYEDLKKKVDLTNGQIQRGEHNLEGAKSALKRIWKGASPWSEVKKRGIDALDEETKKVAENLIQELRKIGIFLVPVGELEGWIDFGIKDKKKWILQALPAIHEGKAPEPLQEFVREILTYLSIPVSN